MDKLAAVKGIAFFEGLPEEKFTKLADIAVIKSSRKERRCSLAMCQPTDSLRQSLAE